MPAAGRAQSEPPGKNATLTSSATELLNATAASSGANDAEKDDPILATLKRPPLKKRNPANKWDGRVAGMSLKEYRDRKWSVDACYAKVERRGPAFSIRRPLPSFLDLNKKSTNFSVGDVATAFDKTLRSSPSFTMGVQYSVMGNPERSQGPAEYKIKSTMDPDGHPTVPKQAGARFGSEVLQPRDPPGPAPGDYDPDAIDNSSTLKRPPNFTIQGREAWRPPTEAPGPGVGEYDVSKAMRTGKITTVHWTAQGKTEPIDPPLGQRQYETPGCAHYKTPHAFANNHPMKHQAAKWKFGSEPRGLR